MAALPELKSPIVAAIFAAREAEDKPRDAQRVRLSSIGHACERWLWYQYRWAAPNERFDGRMLRLFERGQREEDVFSRELRSIGVDLVTHEPDGSQRAVSFCNGQAFGYVDGVALSGVPGAEKTPHLVEFKTHGSKSYAKLIKDGVAKAKPDHFAQMQVYMHGLSLTRALYLAVNKDTDELHAERLEYDHAYAVSLEAKAGRIVAADSPAQRLHDDPEAKMAFECKNCPALDVCHFRTPARRNCRTCVHSTPIADAKWRCEKHDREIDTAWQAHGCPSHLMLPGLVNGEPIAADPTANTITYRAPNGAEFTMGGDHEQAAG
jgi:hypothetical protein